MWIAVSYPENVLNPFASPNANITVPIGQSYDMTFEVRAAAQSIANDTQPGTVWFSSNWMGYGDGVCLNADGYQWTTGSTPTVTPGTLVRVSVNVTEPATLGARQANQSVYWTFGEPTGRAATYTVAWTPAAASSSSSSSTTSASQQASSVSLATSSTTATVGDSSSGASSGTVTSSSTSSTSTSTSQGQADQQALRVLVAAVRSFIAPLLSFLRALSSLP